MKIYPESIQHLGESRYLVKIATSLSKERQEFIFTVTGDEIRTVESPPGFWLFLANSFGSAKHLLQAILSLDMSRGIEVPEP